MAADKQNLQDAFLNNVRKGKVPVTIFLMNGVKLQGVITWFDNFCVLLRRDGQSQLVYKHAISTVMPSQPITLYEAVRGSLAQLVLPGDNPDIASLILEHENGALSTLNACYASAGEYYLMNIYGKEATAYYDLHSGLRVQKRHSNKVDPVPCAKNDTIVEELEEFAAAVRGQGRPEMDGEKGTASLAVLLAGIRAAREGRRVEIAEVLAG